MELILVAIAVVFVGVAIYYNRNTKSFDVNRDGKVDSKDAVQAVKNVTEGVKHTADVNKDGKVDSDDVKAVAAKTKAAAKTTAAKVEKKVAGAANKAKAAVKKTAPKKTAPKKP